MIATATQTTTISDNGKAPGMCSWALAYAGRGLFVIPLHSPQPNGGCSCGKPDCKSPGKHPRFSQKQASTDEATVRRWWQKWPDANIGVVCEPSGLVMVDVDPRNGGDDTWAAIRDDLHLDVDTWVTLTGGGGMHVWFRRPDGVDPFDLPGTLGAGVDVKRAGGDLVVVPPSLHPSEKRYAFEASSGPNEVDKIAELPPGLMAVSRQNGASNGTEIVFSGDLPDVTDLDTVLASLKPPGNQELRDFITTDPNETARKLGKSRSEVDQMVITRLRFRGATPELIKALFLGYPIGQRYDEHGDKYLVRSIQNADTYLEHVRRNKTTAVPPATALDPIDLDAEVQATIAKLQALPEGVDRDRMFSDELIPLLAQLSGTPGFGRYSRDVKKKLGINVGDLKEMVDTYAKRQKTNQASLEYPPSWPYGIEDGRIVFLRESTLPSGEPGTVSFPIADFTATITEEITAEDGNRTFVIVGTAVRGGPFQTEISADDYSDDRKLKAAIEAAAGARDPVRAGMVKHLGVAIKLLTDDNLARTHRYHRTGWADGHFLIPGREPPNASIQLERQLPYRINREAELTLGLQALEGLINSLGSDRTTVALSTIFQGPLARYAGWRNERYVMMITGLSGTFKTSWAQVAMSIFGPGFMRDELLIKWGQGATANAIMNMATKAYDMPFLIDNYKPNTGGGPQAFINLTHNILEGGEKARLNRAAQLRDTKPVFCWPIFTGEDVPDIDPASLARVLVVLFDWPKGEPNHDLKTAQHLSEHLCAVGGTWLDWLETDAGRRAAEWAAAEFPRRREQWANELRATRDDTVNVLRVASNLASNELTWAVLEQHPDIGELAQLFVEQYRAGLTDVARGMSRATAESLAASRYLDALRELLGAGRAILLPKDHLPDRQEETELERNRDRIIGWREEDGSAYLLPKTARQAVERLLGGHGLEGVSETELYRQLARMNMLASRGTDRHTRSVRIQGSVERVLHLRPEALEAQAVTDSVTGSATTGGQEIRP